MLGLEYYLNLFNMKWDDKMISYFDQYYKLLAEWNDKINLTSIIDYQEVLIKHFVDSLSIIKVLPDIGGRGAFRLLDVGTGAGFPALPIKFMYENIKMVLMDSTNKKISFLNHIIHELSLKNINAVQERAEEAAHKEQYREKFDICVSRAVAKLSTLAEYCIPFVKVNGYFISYKSGRSENEIKEAGSAVKELGGGIEHIEKFMLPETDMERILILIKKKKQTKDRYPRMGGKPLKSPISC